jgi:predicted XRE-type DNA-binding protein
VVELPEKIREPTLRGVTGQVYGYSLRFLVDVPRLVRLRLLVQRISDITAERKLSQASAAKLLGIDQPKVSALLRGRLDGFSIDRLIRFLNALGRDVVITIRPARRVEDAGTRVV